MVDEKENSTLTTKQKLRILWHSNAPWVPTGYGNQTNLVVPRLQKAGYQMALSTFYGLQGGYSKMGDIPVYPASEDVRSYGTDVIGMYANAWNADIALTLIDAWVLDAKMLPPGRRWVTYYPVDCTPVPIAVFRKINTAFDRIAMSKFGVQETNNAGLSCHYVPHGIDTEVVYRPLDQIKSREQLAKAIRWDKDAFIIGMVAANKGFPDRKVFEPQLRAFARLKEKHSDAQMYIHTYANDRGTHEGVNIPELVQFLGLTMGRDVFLPDPEGYKLGYAEDFMRLLYSSFDVHTLVSMGEGFGIPIVEAQACGCPVVVGDWTSMPELCFSGWKVPQSGAEKFYMPFGGYQFRPNSDAIYEAYEQAYEMRGNHEYRKAARTGALRYNIDKVIEKYWLPTLEKIAERIEQSK